MIDSAGILSAQELSSGKCDQCGLLSFQISDLRKHKTSQICRAKEPTEPQKCSLCGQGFNSKGNLQRHKISRHKYEPKKTEESYRDYNKMVAILNEDAEREADQKKESKIKR